MNPNTRMEFSENVRVDPIIDCELVNQATT